MDLRVICFIVGLVILSAILLSIIFAKPELSYEKAIKKESLRKNATSTDQSPEASGALVSVTGAIRRPGIEPYLDNQAQIRGAAVEAATGSSQTFPGTYPQCAAGTYFGPITTPFKPSPDMIPRMYQQTSTIGAPWPIL